MTLMNPQLEKLNRLRVNAGKNELKAWKSTQASLEAQISKFEGDGFTDAVPGADIKVVPTTTDPEIIAAMKPKEEPAEAPSLADSALSKSIDKTPAPQTEGTLPTTKGRASLARGLDTDTMAQQSRMAVQMNRSAEKKAKKAAEDAAKPKLSDVVSAPKVKLSKKDKKQIKEQANAPLPKGQVDPAVDPDKAARQAKHIEDKKAKREAEGKPAKVKAASDDKTITAADLARDLDIDPKVARAKLRRYEGKKDYPATIKGERWTFPKSARDALVAILDKK